MRAIHVFLIVLAPGLAISAAAACAPILGIQSRYDGPTWCEEDAQATNNGYCNDFDYILPSTVNQQDPANVPDSATINMNADVASSPPNSLYVTSPALRVNESLLVGDLVSVSAMPMPQQRLVPFECEADFYVPDLLKIPTTVGIIAVGAPLVVEEPQVVAVLVEPGDGGPTLAYALLRFPAPPNPPIMIGTPCDAGRPPPIRQLASGDWLTIKMFFAPPDTVDASASLPGICHRGFDGGGGGAGLNQDYAVVAQAGIFDFSSAILFPPPHGGFTPLPYFAYGLFRVEDGGATPEGFGLHVDNVRCTQKPPGVP